MNDNLGHQAKKRQRDPELASIPESSKKIKRVNPFDIKAQAKAKQVNRWKSFQKWFANS